MKRPMETACRFLCAGAAVLALGAAAEGAIAAQAPAPPPRVANAPSSAELLKALAAREDEVKARLAGMEVSDSARATILYPYELVRLVQSGARPAERTQLGRRLERSDQVLAAAEQGRDITVRAVGDQARHYFFADAGEIMPYRLYVPTTWNGREALPVVLALHGAGSDESELLTLDDNKMMKLAERYRYIVVAPLGYRPIGTYGTPIVLPSVYGSTGRQGREVGGPERVRMMALSEKDVLNVLELTLQEYGADRSRVFITGHSMGGGGTWHLAHQHRALWAGAAASAGPFFTDGYDFERLRGLPLMILQGDADLPSLEADRRLTADLLGKGIGVTYVETAGVNHGQTYGASLPSIFEFFERQKLKANPRQALPLH